MIHTECNKKQLVIFVEQAFSRDTWGQTGSLKLNF